MMAGDVVSPQMQPRAPQWMPIGAPQTNIQAHHRGSTSIGKAVMGLATATRLQENATDQAMQRRDWLQVSSTFTPLSSSGACTRVRASLSDWHAAPKHKEDREVVHEAAKLNGYAPERAVPKLKADRKFRLKP